MSEAGKKTLKFVLFFGLGILIIWLFQRNLSPEEKKQVGDTLLHADWGMMAIMVLFGIISNVFRTLRWNRLIYPLGFKPRFHNTFMSICTAYFANLAVPRLGEVLRCTFMQRYEKVPFQKSLGTVVTERALDLLCFLLLFVASFAVEYRNLKDYVSRLFASGVENAKGGRIILWSIFAVVAVVAVGCVVLTIYYRKNSRRLPEKHLLKRIANIFNGFGEGITSLKHIARPWAFVVETLGIWACYWMMMFFSFHSISGLEHTGVGLALIAMTMGSVGTMITPGGIGLYPVIISETLAIFGFSKVLGYSAGWIAWGVQTLVVILAGIVSIAVLPLINKSGTQNGGDLKTPR